MFSDTKRIKRIKDLYIRSFPHRHLHVVPFPGCRRIADDQHLCQHPVISVRLVVFNHEPWLKQALDSILEQEIEEEYEIVISDDGSTDRSLEICKAYQSQYPDKIVIYCVPKNSNFQIVQIARDACRGTYICSLEGDDYWCNPLKMSKQLKLIRTNHADACFAQTLVECNGHILENKKYGTCRHYNIHTACDYRNLAHISSWMIKSEFYRTLRFVSSPISVLYDYEQFIRICTYGKAVGLSEVVSCYRITGKGLATSESLEQSHWTSLGQWLRIYLTTSPLLKVRSLTRSVDTKFLYYLKYAGISEQAQMRISILLKIWKLYCPWYRLPAQIKFYHRLHRWECALKSALCTDADHRSHHSIH